MSKNNYSMKEAIELMLTRYKLRSALDEITLRETWKRLMGEYIAVKTYSIVLKNKVLHLKIDSPELRHELLFSKAKIIKVMNEELGEGTVEDVNFR
ncbi:MAG: DUF721 domain-containing protein [Bacteroidetes bacterium]|nr:DUF721 domain-containing protein [Bacteroidota bacterium]